MAARYFDKAVSLKVSNSELYKNYGTVLFQLENYDLAIKYFKLAINLEPYDSDSFYNIGNALYRKACVSNSKEDFLQAVDYLEQGISVNPDSEKLYLLIGMCYRSCGLYENARNFYEKTLMSEKFSKYGFYNLIGNTFREEGKYKEALSYYEKAREYDNSFVAVYCNIGDMHLKLDDDEMALLNYHRAIEIDRNFIVPYISIANLYYCRNNFQEAKFWALKALKINSDNDKANYILGMAYKNLKNKNESIKYLKHAVFCGNDDAVYELRSIGIDWR
jgi:tetratricopeptide (TPR) repeat protein